MTLSRRRRRRSSGAGVAPRAGPGANGRQGERFNAPEAQDKTSGEERPPCEAVRPRRAEAGGASASRKRRRKARFRLPSFPLRANGRRTGKILSGICRTCRSSGRRRRFAAGSLREIPKTPISEGRGPHRTPEPAEPFGDLRRSERRNDRIFRRLPDPNFEIPQRSVQVRKTPPFALRSRPLASAIAVPCPSGRSTASVAPGSNGRTA